MDALLEEEKRKKEEQQAAKKRAFVNERINEENKRRQAAHDQAKKDGRTDAQIELDEKIKDTRKNYDARMGAWLLVIPLFIIWTLGLGFSAMIEILDGW